MKMAAVMDETLELLSGWEQYRTAEFEAISAMPAGPERDQRLQALLLEHNRLFRLLYVRL